jgi:glyoxylase-like metal-dependent hydrolase (beta-lactamase superfamily II)
LDTSFVPRYGETVQLTPLIRRVVAENPGPFTFYGTGTYIVGRGAVAVIDPGPLLPSHFAALRKALEGERVTHILVTHTHLDHSPLARPLQQATGAPILGFGPHGTLGGVEVGADLEFRPDVALRDGERVAGEGWTFEAIHTPGHAANHLCFALEEENALFCGDQVMGWSTTVVAPPDGDMALYMQALERLAARPEAPFYPTHGNPIRDPRQHVAALIQHRLERRAKVLAALDATPRAPAELVPPVYGPTLDPRLIGGAAASLLAHLIELKDEGLVVEMPRGWTSAD